MRVGPITRSERDTPGLEFDDANGPRVALWITPDGLEIELDDRTLVTMRGRLPRDVCERLAAQLGRAFKA